MILQIQIARLRNAARAIWAANPVEAAILGCAALLLAAYEVLDTMRGVARCGACRAAVVDHAGLCALAILVMTVWVGFSAGCASAVQVRGVARASWLAVLPWDVRARSAAARRAVLAHGVAASGVVVLITGATCGALRLAHPVGLAGLTGLVCMAGFAGGGVLRLGGDGAGWRQDDDDRPRGGRLPAPLRYLDRLAPRHAGLWAWSGHVRLILGACVLSLVPMGSAAAASIAQRQAVPAVALAVIGGNLVFVLALRCRPVRSAVFRASPLGFAAAAASMARLPLAVSGAWFAAVLAVPLVASDPARRIAPAGGLALLILDGLYLAAALFRPESPRQAMLLYACGAYAVVTETATAGIPYGVLTLAAVLGMASLLLLRARRAYRGGHG